MGFDLKIVYYRSVIIEDLLDSHIPLLGPHILQIDTRVPSVG